MTLPLIEKAIEGNPAFHLTSTLDPAHEAFAGLRSDQAPGRLPGPGEQYRFHFDMTKCTGCKCCVVACNEQNANPAGIQWRRVGEIEGGIYPETHRHYLSMGCNHCLEPSCLTGCPVDAYSKDPITGIVLHSAEACIGCQYCTWNCSYGVPQYNPERGVVGKCDMCYGRLAQGQTSACASACPTGAIQIEIIDTAEWRKNYAAAANAPGMPPAHHSLSTTKISQPRNLPADLERVNLNRLHLEEPHWPLVFMTVLTQFSVGAFAALWLLESTGHEAGLRLGGAASLLIALAALGASTLHLGRPIHAYRAMKMWRRSWLSREVLLFSIFAVVASLGSAAMFYEPHAVPVLGALTVVAGVAGVGSSARVYMVPGRPAWNSVYTAAEFALTTVVLGILFVPLFPGSPGGLRYAGPAVGLAIMLTAAAKFFRLHRSRRHELRATARLLSTVLAAHLFWRAALMAAALAVAFSSAGRGSAIAALLLAAGSELLGRYLFFVSVVPTNMAAGYLAAQEAA